MFEQDIRALVGDRGLVTWSFCNWGQRDMALNWWRHFERVGPHAKALVFCLDERTRDDLGAEGARTALAAPPHDVSPDGLEFRSSVAWTRITAMKLLITRELLKAGIANLYSDTDVVARKDPTATMLKSVADRDVVFQANHMNNICSGIYLARPTAASLALFDVDTPGLPAYEFDNPHYDDQYFIQHRVAVMGDALSWAFLPSAGFPNGAIWYANRARLWDGVEMVHYNCLIGTPAKVTEMKRDGAWIVGEKTAMARKDSSAPASG